MGTRTRPRRLAYLTSHPVQYQAPLLRAVSGLEDVELHAWFLSDFSARHHYDPECGLGFSWDVALTEGYEARFLSKSDRPAGWHRPLGLAAERRLRRESYDALWLHGWSHPLQWRIARLAFRSGWRVLLRGETPLLSGPVAGGAFASGSLRRMKHALTGRLLRRAHACLAIGRANRRFYESHGVEQSRIYEMPYGVDNEWFATRQCYLRPQREELRAQLGLPAGRPVVLFAGKLVERKRPMDLVDALGRIGFRSGGMEPAAVFVGEGKQRPRLESAVRRLGLRHVVFAGFQNQSAMPRYYDLCDLLVLPSEHEPWGLVLNEAMACGRPVICSDRVGAREDLVIEGETGLGFATGDVDGLAAAITRLSADPGLRAGLGHRARERVRLHGIDRAVSGLQGALSEEKGR